MSRARAPRLARLLLMRLLPREVRDEIAGDLEERFTRDHAGAGAVRAHARYLRALCSFPLHFAVARLREAAPARMPMALDVKLGVRMLARYPGLTLVSTIGIAAGIAISAGAYSVIGAMSRTDLPFEDGDRIVAIQNRDIARDQPERRALHDLATWRSDVSSVTDVGAFRNIERNLLEAGRSPETVRIAEMSAAGFAITGVPPLMGRVLREADERPEAPPVVVIGEDVWRERFTATPDIVGRSLQIGDTVHTVVGVMPASYAFPFNDDIWLPFRLDPLRYEPRTGPTIHVFGRLAPGATLEQAQAEFDVLGQRAAEASPATHARLSPQVMPYPYPFSDWDDPSTQVEAAVIQSMLLLMLCIVCVNVSVLVYARTATRYGEISIRTALGAGRRRIVGQLFTEALVLAGLACGVGLVIAAFGLGRLDAALPTVSGGPLPFWLRFGLTPRVVAYAIVLTFVAAVIVGVLPALKATGRSVQAGLKTVSMGGGAGMQLGRVWTLLIIGQVALTVALLPPAIYYAWDAVSNATRQPSREMQEVVTASLSIDTSSEEPPAALDARFATHHAEFMRRLREQQGVSHATFSLTTPGQEGAMFLEIDGVSAPAEGGGYSLAEGSSMGHLARLNRVDVGFFDTFDVALLAGRLFGTADTAASANAIIVNRSFVHQFLPGAGASGALGRRIRYVGRGGDTNSNQVELERWYEIVGIVEDYPVMRVEQGTPPGRIYHAMAPGAVRPALISLRTPGGAPTTIGDTVRTTAASVDASLQVRRVNTLAHVVVAEKSMWRIIASVIGGLTLAVITLSAAGIYALMSFTVSQRRREIGIRSALGADPRRILTGIFARALVQLLAGAAVGLAIAVLLENTSEGETMGGNGAIVLPIVALIMTVVGLAAAYGPARRGLRIHPTEALRAE